MIYPKILIIAPYEGLAESFSQIVQDRDDILFTIRVGNLEEGLQIAIDENYSDYDIIISRGGTADLLRASLDIPVVDANASVYDILRAIKMAENFSGKFAIVGFASITECAKTLCNLLQYDIEIITYASQEDAFQAIKQLADRHFDLIIGDMIGTIVCNQMGLSSILISTGSECIQECLDNALRTVSYSSYIKHQKDLFRAILTTGSDDHIILDEQGNIYYSTLGTSLQDQSVMELIHSHTPTFLQKPGHKVAQKSGDLEITIENSHYLYQNQKYTFLKITKKQFLVTESDPSIMIYDRSAAMGNFSGHFNSANYVGDTRSLIENYGATSFPILITGENGTGKDRAATLIHESSPLKNAPFYTVDCSLFTDRQWTSLLTNVSSPLTSARATIYFRRADSLSLVKLEELVKYNEQTNLSKRNRLIFSMLDTPGSSAHAPIKNKLTNVMLCMLLRLQPLRERVSDLPSIMTLYINQTNTALGKQIVGFSPDAMEQMKHFSWPHNLDQLHRIIRELCAVTQGPYISADSVRLILNKEIVGKTCTLNSDAGFSLDLSRSLDEINFSIVTHVLAEENNNREAAAKRLGISRSTLWRMLKSHTDI